MEPIFAAYLHFLERVLTPGRLRHSLGVMQMMDELTAIYPLNREKALTAGLLHDAAKELAPEARKQIIQEAGIQIQTDWERDYVNYMHGPVSAYFIQRELGICDPLVLDAITMHTFCGEGENMEAPLVWCLRFADILEPNRKWNEMAHLIRDREPQLRRLVYAGHMTEAALLQTDMLIRFYEETGHPVHPNMRRIYHEKLKYYDLEA